MIPPRLRAFTGLSTLLLSTGHIFNIKIFLYAIICTVTANNRGGATGPLLLGSVYMAQYTGFDWCITANAKKKGARAETKKIDDVAPESEEWKAFSELVTLYQNLCLPNDMLEYAIVQGEYVSNYHLQAFVQFTREVNKSDVIQFLKEISAGVECYVAKRLGTPKQAQVYCGKLESSWELFPKHECGVFNEIDRHKVRAVREALIPKHKHAFTWVCESKSFNIDDAIVKGVCPCGEII